MCTQGTSICSVFRSRAACDVRRLPFSCSSLLLPARSAFGVSNLEKRETGPGFRSSLARDTEPLPSLWLQRSASVLHCSCAVSVKQGRDREAFFAGSLRVHAPTATALAPTARAVGRSIRRAAAPERWPRAILCQSRWHSKPGIQLSVVPCLLHARLCKQPTDAPGSRL